MAMFLFSLLVLLQVAVILATNRAVNINVKQREQRAIHTCIKIVQSSPTILNHSDSLCFCKMCSYVRANVTEMKVYAHLLERK